MFFPVNSQLPQSWLIKLSPIGKWSDPAKHQHRKQGSVASGPSNFVGSIDTSDHIPLSDELQSELQSKLISWLVVEPPLRKIFVSWHDYTQDMESHKSHVPVTTNQVKFRDGFPAKTAAPFQTQSDKLDFTSSIHHLLHLHMGLSENVWLIFPMK